MPLSGARPLSLRDLGVNLGRFVDQGLPKLLAELGRVRMAMLFDGVTYRNREHFFLRASNRHAAVALAGHTPAVDHLARSGRHRYLEECCRGDHAVPGSAAGRGAPPEGVGGRDEYWGGAADAQAGGRPNPRRQLSGAVLGQQPLRTVEYARAGRFARR